jgi:hypothetical protein
MIEEIMYMTRPISILTKKNNWSETLTGLGGILNFVGGRHPDRGISFSNFTLEDPVFSFYLGTLAALRSFVWHRRR